MFRSSVGLCSLREMEPRSPTSTRSSEHAGGQGRPGAGKSAGQGAGQGTGQGANTRQSAILAFVTAGLAITALNLLVDRVAAQILMQSQDSARMIIPTSMMWAILIGTALILPINHVLYTKNKNQNQKWPIWITSTLAISALITACMLTVPTRQHVSTYLNAMNERQGYVITPAGQEKEVKQLSRLEAACLQLNGAISKTAFLQARQRGESPKIKRVAFTVKNESDKASALKSINAAATTMGCEPQWLWLRQQLWLSSGQKITPGQFDFLFPEPRVVPANFRPDGTKIPTAKTAPAAKPAVGAKPATAPKTP